MSGAVLNMIMLDLEPSGEIACNDWLNGEHVSELLNVPGWLTAQRYVALEGTPKYLHLYDLRDLAVLTQPAFLKTRPWDPEAKPRAKEMFTHYRNLRRGIYHVRISVSGTNSIPALPTPVVLVAGFDVQGGSERDCFDTWCEKHCQKVIRIPGVVRCRQLRCDPHGAGLTTNSPPGDALVYDLLSSDAVEHPAWNEATQADGCPAGISVNPRWRLYRRIFPE